jgi:heme A synthase
MINWYGVLILSFVITILALIALTILKVVPLLLALFLYILGIPVVFFLLGYIIYKLGQNGYIDDEEFPR